MQSTKFIPFHKIIYKYKIMDSIIKEIFLDNQAISTNKTKSQMFRQLFSLCLIVLALGFFIGAKYGTSSDLSIPIENWLIVIAPLFASSLFMFFYMVVR